MKHSHGESYIAETEGHTIHSWARYYDLVLGILLGFFRWDGRENSVRPPWNLWPLNLV